MLLFTFIKPKRPECVSGKPFFPEMLFIIHREAVKLLTGLWISSRLPMFFTAFCLKIPQKYAGYPQGCG
jgi:hypothetical protein